MKTFRKLGVGFLSFMLALSGMLTFKNTVKTVNANSANIQTKIVETDVTIGNEYISRQFSIKDNKLYTKAIFNHRTEGNDTIFQPAVGSEEFIIKTTKEAKDPITLPAIDRSGWSAEANSRQNASGPSDGPASNLLDGNLNSIWHTNYGGGIGPENYPYYVLFSLNKETIFQSFSYTPRQNGEDTNGNIKKYELYASNKSYALEADSNEWELISKGSFEYNGVDPIYVNLKEAVTATQLKFVPISANNGMQFAGGAEFNLHEDKAPIIPEDTDAIKSSDLELKENGVNIEDTSATINNIEKAGKKLTFAFKPYTYNGVEFTINEVMVMYEGDHFMRKFLEISVPNDKQDAIAIDYIDLEHLNINEDDQQWTVPTDAGGVVSLNQYKANLGQPIYIQGMFFGCEFPVTDTEIVNGTGFMRYYSGKTFEQLRADNQLTSNEDASTYVTWQTVAGAARSTEYDVIQTDFFDYIASIATPSEFRIQYNSWFDNMMLVDDQNILNSFIEMDRELNKTETRPLDSYVVDDGWNNYNNTSVLDAARSGTTLNQSGFWEFNSKFPNGLTPSSELVHNFGSNFGAWVGPRGGYNYYWSLADILTKSGKGSKLGGSIDVADRTYVENFKNMANQWQDNYGVNYWKWDGYADNGQFQSAPATNGVPSRVNNHMVGGYQNMYHVTDLWEAWIDLFESVRQNADKNKIDDLWISLTCYVNPSPWFLQWANSVWLQCTLDRGDSGPLNNKMDSMLTYREAVYYDFLKNHEFQFPLKNIYNHDPVYGREGTGINKASMTDEQFSNYLYMQSTRGTGFWELYYSDSIMTEGKYEVNAEFLEWAEDNFHILRNAKIIGGNPAEGVVLGGNNSNGVYNTYGFSAWDGEEGIISMRNPSNTPMDITFKLDRNIGLSETLQGKDLYRTTIHNYNVPSGNDAGYETLHYGDSVTINLQPGETRIWSLNTIKDTKAPAIARVMSEGDKKLQVKFDEKVTGDQFVVEGAEIESVIPSPDHVSFTINLKEAPKNKSVLKVTAHDIKDLSGNTASGSSKSITYYKKHEVLNRTINDGMISLDSYLNSNNSFTVNAKISTTQTDKEFVKQTDGYTLGIDSQGYAYFELNGARAVSKTKINDDLEHNITGVKENNGILKLYIDTVLVGSAYRADNRYFELPASNMVIGSDGLIGTLEVKVFDFGYGYDDIALITGEGEREPIASDNMSVIVTGTSEGNKDDIFDNDPTTFWTSEKAENGIQIGNPYLQVNLNGSYVLDRIDYTKRYFENPANYWLCTGNLLEYTLEISNDNGATWSTVSTGKTAVDNGKIGGTTEIKFDKVTATNIRISGMKSYHWQAVNENKFMTVGDLKMFGEEAGSSNVDKSALKIMIEQLEAIDTSYATTSSVATFNQLLEAGRAVLAEDDATQAQVDEMVTTLEAAEDLLVARGDVKALSEKVDEINAEKLNEADYTADSWKNFINALAAAELIINDNSDMTQNDVDNVYENLVKAKADLVKVSEDTAFTKTLLLNAINKANAAEESGQLKYLAPSVKKLILDARDAAVKVYDDETATIAQVMEAWMNLADAMHYMDFVANKEALQTLVDTNKDLDMNDYKEGVEAFNTALANAKAVLADDKALQARIDEAYKQLYDAVQGLVEKDKADKKYLEMIVTSIKEHVGDGSKYKKDANWDTFVEALEAAEKVLADENATQEDVEQALSALTGAYEDIRLEPTEDQLDELNSFVDKAGSINRSLYTNAQLKQIDTLVAEAKNMLKDFDSKKYGSLLKDMEDTAKLIDKVENKTPNKPANPSKPSIDGGNGNVANTIKPSAKPNTSDTSNAAGLLFMMLLAGGFCLSGTRRTRKAKE